MQYLYIIPIELLILIASYIPVLYAMDLRDSCSLARKTVKFDGPRLDRSIHRLLSRYGLVPHALLDFMRSRVGLYMTDMALFLAATEDFSHHEADLDLHFTGNKDAWLKEDQVFTIADKFLGSHRVRISVDKKPLISSDGKRLITTIETQARYDKPTSVIEDPSGCRSGADRLQEGLTNNLDPIIEEGQSLQTTGGFGWFRETVCGLGADMKPAESMSLSVRKLIPGRGTCIMRYVESSEWHIQLRYDGNKLYRGPYKVSREDLK